MNFILFAPFKSQLFSYNSVQLFQIVGIFLQFDSVQIFQIVGIFLQFSSIHKFQTVGNFLQFGQIHIKNSLFSNHIIIAIFLHTSFKLLVFSYNSVQYTSFKLLEFSYNSVKSKLSLFSNCRKFPTPWFNPHLSNCRNFPTI